MMRIVPGFDVIGDIHGCADELGKLLEKLGYVGFKHKKNRRIVLVGDLTDRGPKNLQVLKMAMAMVAEGHVVLRGNHDEKLLRWFNRDLSKIKKGLQGTLGELQQAKDYDLKAIHKFLADRPYVFRGMTPHNWTELVVAHAGIPHSYLDGEVQEGELIRHAIYGEVKTDENGQVVKDQAGYPKRTFKFYKSWENKLATLVHGHTKVTEPFRTADVVNVDTGCVSGGPLTAYRFPEHGIVQVKPKRVYHESSGTSGASTAELLKAFT